MGFGSRLAKPGGEYSTKCRRYAETGVLYYVIYNPSHYRRDKHEMFEVYRLEQGEYILQAGNPVWMPEIGLGIGHEKSYQEGVHCDWLFWYNEQGDRYLPPGDVLKQERILRETEQIERERGQLIRRSLEERLEQEQLDSANRLEQERLESSNRLAQERRSIAVNFIQQGIPLETIAQATGLTLEDLKELQANP